MKGWLAGQMDVHTAVKTREGQVYPFTYMVQKGES